MGVWLVVVVFCCVLVDLCGFVVCLYFLLFVRTNHATQTKQICFVMCQGREEITQNTAVGGQF